MPLESYYSTKLSWRRVISSLILIPVLVYLFVGVAAYFLADKLIFQPQPTLTRDDETILKLLTPGGERISARLYKNPNARFAILFSHGNAEDLSVSDSYFEQLREIGFNVFAYDYKGYGTSEGTPSEKGSYEDAETAYNYLLNELKIAPERVILHGRSLGGAVAIDLAARKPCGGLIVESSFVSAFRVLTRYPVFPFDEFRNANKIGKVNCPVLFIHGRNDEIVPFWHGEELFSRAASPKYSFWIENAGHNNVTSVGGEAYFQAIQDFAAKLSD